MYRELFCEYLQKYLHKILSSIYTKILHIGIDSSGDTKSNEMETRNDTS